MELRRLVSEGALVRLSAGLFGFRNMAEAEEIQEQHADLSTFRMPGGLGRPT